MDNLISTRGEFVPIPDDALATLRPEQRALYAPVTAAADKLATAEKDLADALAVIEQDVLLIETCEATLRSFPARSFHDEWKATTGGVTRPIGT